jgi:hypothetical protein
MNAAPAYYGCFKQGRPAGSRIDTSGAMPVPLTGSTALVPMSRLWRPMARTDRTRNAELRARPHQPAHRPSAAGCAPTNTDHPWASRSAVAASLGRLPTPSQATGRVKRARQPASPRSRTSSSNPVPSSSESTANPTSSGADDPESFGLQGHGAARSPASAMSDAGDPVGAEIGGGRPNDRPKPFVCTKSPEVILAAVQRGRQALEAIH